MSLWGNRSPPTQANWQTLSLQICAQFIPARTSLTLPFKSIQKEATETVCQLLSEEKPNERGHNLLGFIFPLFVLGDVWARPNNGMKNCEPCRQV